jgi:hypothetical protein
MHPAAGHRVLLPGELPLVEEAPSLARGGTPEADAALGRATWHELLALLRLG